MTQPATDEQIDYLEQYDFETLSHRVALELLARIRADAERIRAYENGLTWQTTCANCAATLDRCAAETFRAEAAEARYARLAEALDTFVQCHALGGFVQPDEDVLVNAKAALSAPDAQAEALWQLGRQLIEWAAQHWKTGWGTCRYCEIDEHGQHKPDCLHLRAKTAVGTALLPAPRQAGEREPK